MAHMFISPLVVRALRTDGQESFDPAETATWILVNEKTGVRIGEVYATYEAARTALRKLLEGQR